MPARRLRAPLRAPFRLAAPSRKQRPARTRLPMLRIFISHKDKDRAAVLALKQTIERYCRQIDVFASCDAEKLRGGRRWWSAIHGAMDKADWFILLYTTKAEDWSWCVYEAGYFAGKSSSRTDKLVVIHPPGVQVPPPLQHWQSVSAEPDKLRGFLSSVFRPGAVDCHWTGTRKELEAVADRIVDEIRPLGSHSWTANRSMRVIVPPPKRSRQPNLDDLPEGTCVVLDPAVAKLVGIAGEARCPWQTFKAAADKYHFDVASLVRAVAEARGQLSESTSLEQFRGRDRLAYRPIIYNVDYKRSGEVTLELVLWELPPLMDPEITNSFERILRVLNLAARFRRQVSEQHGLEVYKARSRTPGERVELLRRVLYDVNDLSRQARFHRLHERPMLFEAFGEGRRDEVQEMLDRWDAAKAGLKEAVASGRCDEPDAVLERMREVNRMFLRAAAGRLNELVYQFHGTTDAADAARRDDAQPPGLRLSMPLDPDKPTNRADDQPAPLNNAPRTPPAAPEAPF